MRTLLITAAVLLSTAASAQVQVSLQFGNATDTLSVNSGDCANRTVIVTWTSSGTACVDLALWLTEGTECRDTAEGQSTRYSLTSIPVSTLNSQRTGTFSFSVSSLPFSAPTDGGTRSCGVDGVEQEFRLCGATRPTDLYAGCSNTVSRATPGKIFYDAKAPEAPTIQSVDALDGALRVTVSEPTGATRIRLEASLPDGTVVANPDQGVGQGAIDVKDLENGVTYQITAFATDQAGNRSGASEIVEGTPIKTNGFLEEYANAGGKEMGGCGAAGGGVAGGAVLAVLGFWLFSRRNRSWLEQ